MSSVGVQPTRHALGTPEEGTGGERRAPRGRDTHCHGWMSLELILRRNSSELASTRRAASTGRGLWTFGRSRTGHMVVRSHLGPRIRSGVADGVQTRCETKRWTSKSCLRPALRWWLALAATPVRAAGALPRMAGSSPRDERSVQDSIIELGGPMARKMTFWPACAPPGTRGGGGRGSAGQGRRWAPGWAKSHGGKQSLSEGLPPSGPLPSFLPSRPQPVLDVFSPSSTLPSPRLLNVRPLAVVL